ncbi:hypothetical protein G6712_04075 [Polynucleobacter paneuropaeus]|nr:hypothetical protein [Polynucleobacter paneuropaeus]
MNPLFNNKLKIFFGLLWLALFLSGLFSYAGSKSVFVLFSFVFLMMLLSGVNHHKEYGFLFLVVFLWLGFWFKLTASLLLSAWFPFVFEEPIGNFNFSVDAWDQVLWIAIWASIGVILGRFLYGLFRLKTLGDAVGAKAPLWYPAVRIWLWAAVLLVTVGVAIFNIFYGIHQIGIVPRAILQWPLNALINWMLNLGSALAISVLIWWDTEEKKNITLPLFAILGEAFLSAVSIISRSTFLFHTIPQMLSLSSRKEISRRYSRRQILLFISTFAVLFLMSIAAVSFMRDYQYAGSKSTPLPAPYSATDSSVHTLKPIPVEASTQPVKETSSFRLTLIRQLLINRWIGIEGVMAVSSYPKKSGALFWEMLTEKREAGKVSAYQLISNSGYQSTDDRYQFASLPGAIAFLYYSGSMEVVMLGMALLTLIMLMLERAIFALTKNPLVCSLFGITAANTVAQFGITPRQDIPFFLMIILTAIIIYFVQSKTFASVLARFSPDSFNN